VAQAIDPVLGGGDACATTPADPEPGTAAYTLPAAPPGGYTLIGAPAITAEIRVLGARRGAQLAARLWDVAPGGARQTLVARGVYRPDGSGRAIWQLHPNGWRFAAGHSPKLQLLGSDMPYARVANLPYTLSVSGLELRLPVREAPDCSTVMPTTPPELPPGQELAPGVFDVPSAGC
ncbi:MAG: type transport system ATP-binding protein, partial [Solirubrobacteraceae bacterium]|nr:type transport system ATP-binding protein [Solirubrobacteraceae bacterium]